MATRWCWRTALWCASPAKRSLLLRRSAPRKGGRVTKMPEPGLLGNEQKQPPETSSLYRLFAWLSPAYPVGAFSYSSGLEWAVEAGDTSSAHTLCRWLATLLTD